jgi:hypothetical protein
MMHISFICHFKIINKNKVHFMNMLYLPNYKTGLFYFYFNSELGSSLVFVIEKTAIQL